MAEIIKDLGIVTAYAYAVAKGYTGTEDEFAALMADYTVIGQEAADAVLEAQRQAGLAAGSAANAETSKDAAVAAKEDAILAKGNAQAAAISAASSEATAIEKAAEAGRSVTDAANSATAAARSASNAHDSADTAHDSEVAAQSYASQAAASSVSASGFADNAEESAGDAADSASAAASSASAAASSVQTAAGHAASAAASAVSAENSASAAAESASSALESKNAAGASATAAASSESNAAQSESNASQSATDAANSATAAAGSEANAAQSAQAAQDVLDSIPEDYTELTEQVAENTEALKTKAEIDGYYSDMTVGNAEQLVSTVGVDDNAPHNYRTSGGSADIGDRETLNAVVGGSLAWNQLVRDEASKNTTDFADIVSVTDATADSAAVEVAIEPVQDLHGYESPWPGGGGVNKCGFPAVDFTLKGIRYYTVNGILYVDGTSSGETSSNSQEFYALSLTLPAGTYYFSRHDLQYPVYLKDAENNSLVQNVGSFTLSEETTLHVGFYIYQRTFSNSEVTISIVDGSIEPISYAPYSNICPITGHTAVNVMRCGKNLFGGDTLKNGIVENLPSATVDTTNKTVSFTAAAVPTGTNDFIRGKTPFKENTRYTFIITYSKNSGVYPNMRIFYTDGSVQDIESVSSTNTKETVVTVSYANKTVLRLGKSNQQGNTTVYYDECGIFEGVLTAEDFVAYSGTTYPITIPSTPGTVYGGTLTVAEDGSGVLTVDRSVWTLDGVNIKFTGKYNDTNGKSPLYFNGGDRYKFTTVNGAFSNVFVKSYAGINLAPLYGFPCGSGSTSTCTAMLPGGTSVEDGNEWLKQMAQNGTPVQVVRLLDTPQTYTLTAAEVTTLLGENHIWSDAGQVSLTYTGTHEFLTLQNGRKYLTHLDGTDAMVAGTGQTIEAVKGTDNVFDLTQMWGSSVADVAYAQGPSWFRKYFPKAKYLYNAGEIMNVKTSGHKMIGFNLLEEDVISGTWTGYANQMPEDSAAKLKAQLIKLKRLNSPLFYKVDASNVQTTGIAVGSIKFMVNGVLVSYTMNPNMIFNLTALDCDNITRIYVYGTNPSSSVVLSNACINLSWDGERDGEYEPYEERTYPLDSSLELRGIPKLDASNNLYYNGDRYLPDGTVERRYGVVDLGTLNWDKQTLDNVFNFRSEAISQKIVENSQIANIVCEKYRTVSNYAIARNDAPDKSISLRDVTIAGFRVYDLDFADKTANEFKAAMQGVLLIYELATPTTETAETYQETQIVDDFGTEEFIDERDIPIPVGHETVYQPNLRAKLEMAPDSPSDDGDYIVRHVNGQNEYIALPAMPTANGAYVLKVTVSNGTPTLAWEAST